MMLSVIMPVYNSQEYLNEAVFSVLNQTYKDFELILIDDGSSDKSGEMCDELAICDGRVVVFHKENGGPASAHKVGIRESRGVYLTFVDSDDYIEPNAFEILISKMVEYKCDLVASGMTIIGENIKNDLNISLEGFYSGEKFDVEVRPHIIFSQPKPILLSVRPGKIFKKELVVNNLNLYREDIRFVEDYTFLIPYYYNMNNVYIVNERFYYYRLNPNSLTKNFKYHSIDDIRKLIDFTVEFIKMRGITDQNMLDQLNGVNTSSVFSIIMHLCLYSRENKKAKLDMLKEIIHDKKFRNEIKHYKFAHSIKTKVLILMIKLKMYRLIYSHYTKHKKKEKLN